MSKYIAYKKDGKFDLDEGFIDQSCFKEKTNKEIKKIFAKDGFDLEIIDQDKFLELTSSQIDSIKIVQTKKYNEVELLRKSYQFQPISYQGSEFSTSQMARQNITAILAENTLSGSHYWKDINETAFDFTLDDFKAISKLISGRDTKLYYIEAQIINEIKSLDLASIQSLNIIDSWQIHEANY